MDKIITLLNTYVTGLLDAEEKFGTRASHENNPTRVEEQPKTEPTS